MIVYDKLGLLLKEKGMNWKDLTNCGISANMPFKFSQNKNMNTESIDKVCAYLNVQPSDIMEFITDEEYTQRESNKKNKERLAIEKEIARLQEQLKNM